MSVSVREARAGDGCALHRLVCELADHHGDLQHVVSTPEQLEAALCVPSDCHGCLVAEVDGEVVGLAYWYEIFTTFTARNKIYLEDIVVSTQARGTGAGFALMKSVAQICVERECPRFEWLAMSDNVAGQKFYTQIGGKVLEGAETWQLWHDDIAALAEAEA
jgi:GNAT superfamily N-acetyltransferase